MVGLTVDYCRLLIDKVLEVLASTRVELVWVYLACSFVSKYPSTQVSKYRITLTQQNARPRRSLLISQLELQSIY